MDVGGKQPRLGTSCMSKFYRGDFGDILPTKYIHEVYPKNRKFTNGFVGTLFPDRPKYQDCSYFVSYAAREAALED